MATFKEELQKIERNNLLFSYQHPPFLLECELARAMSDLNRQRSYELLNQINALERAVLSENPLESLKYSLVASCTCYTRTSIKAGVDSEVAFNASDYFIREISNLRSTRVLNELEFTMLDSFMDLIEQAKRRKYTKDYNVNQIINYIRKNIVRQITLNDLAEATGLHPNYISALFAKEMNCPISEYIAANRVLSIKQFLSETTISLSEISDIFNFNSPSHFSVFFKKHTGMTPRAYRNMSRPGV